MTCSDMVAKNKTYSTGPLLEHAFKSNFQKFQGELFHIYSIGGSIEIKKQMRYSKNNGKATGNSLPHIAERETT